MKSYFHILNLRSEIRILKRKTFIFLSAVFFIWYIDCLPAKLFSDSTSTVILDQKGKLLGAHISEDEQWRFEECDSVPVKFEKAIIAFEDKTFRSHWGVSVRGISRAVMQNFRNGQRVSGGSTLTMQLARLMLKNPKRTYTEKVYEIVLATRIEFSYSKDEILRLYASHAPFGNNVVGIDAAAWRFFGRPAHELSWAESATLAVLPNAPGLIYPGKNHQQLLKKRNRLLKVLYENKEFDATTFQMALLEPLPDRPLKLPNVAPHLLSEISRMGNKGKTVYTTVKVSVQEKTNQLLEQHMELLRENQIYNGAVIVKDVHTGETIAYVGNAVESGREHASYVNCIKAPRSSGSILKPLLYEKALESSVISPEMLLLDAPSKFGGFSPKNFSGSFEGLIPADEALARSLNIPMVHLLNQYGLAHFHSDLKQLGFSTLKKPSNHYGLSLILGGAEVSLQELSNCYTAMAQQLEFGKVTKVSLNSEISPTVNTEFPMNRGAIYSTFDAMLEVRRPDDDLQWQMFESSRKIAWKTGTSFGFRDAWAVGVSPDYVVAVWIGNADGEGRPGLIGTRAAAPLMFDVFQSLPMKKTWFKKPLEQLQKVEICMTSGHLATENCEQTKNVFVPKASLDTRGCPYHQLIHLNKEGSLRVNAECTNPSQMLHKPWFIIAPSIEKWYSKANPAYLPAPKMSNECTGLLSLERMALIYPKNKQKIYLPVDFTKNRRKMTIEAAITGSESTIFWHLDEEFIGQTQMIHQLEIQPEVGKHVLTISDESGITISAQFEVLGKE